MPRTLGGPPDPAASSAAAGSLQSTPQSNPWARSQLHSMLGGDEDLVPEFLRGSAAATPSPQKKGPQAKCSAGSPARAARLSRMATPSKGRLSDSSRSSSDSSNESMDSAHSDDEGEDQPAGGSLTVANCGALATPAEPGQRASPAVSAPHSAAAEPGAAAAPSLSRRALHFGCDVPAVTFRSLTGPQTPCAELVDGRDEPAVGSRRTSTEALVQLDSRGRLVEQAPAQSAALPPHVVADSLLAEAERMRRSQQNKSREAAETAAALQATKEIEALERRSQIDTTTVYHAIKTTLKREIHLSSLMVPPDQDAFAGTEAPCRVIDDPDSKHIPMFFHPVDLMFTPGVLDTSTAHLAADPACVALFPHWRFSTDPDMNCYVVSLLNVLDPSSLMNRQDDPEKGEGGNADKIAAANFRADVAAWMREQLALGPDGPVWAELCAAWNVALDFKEIESDVDRARVNGFIIQVSGAAALTEDFAAVVAVMKNSFLIQSRFCNLSLPVGLAPIGAEALDRDFLHGLTAEMVTSWPRVAVPPRTTFAPRCRTVPVPGEEAVDFHRGSVVLYNRQPNQKIAHVNPLIPAPDLFNCTVNHPIFPFECTRWTPVLPMADCSFFMVPCFAARRNPVYHRDPANNNALQVQSCSSVVLRPFMLVQDADEREAAADSDSAQWSLILFTCVEVSRSAVDNYLNDVERANGSDAEQTVRRTFLDPDAPPDDLRMTNPLVVRVELPEDWSLEEASDVEQVRAFLNSSEAPKRLEISRVTLDCFHCGPVLLSGNQAQVLVDANNTEATDTAVCLDIPERVLHDVVMLLFNHGLLDTIQAEMVSLNLLDPAPADETEPQAVERVNKMLMSADTVPALWRSFLREVVRNADHSRWGPKANFLQELRHAAPTQHVKPQFVLLADHALGGVADNAPFVGELQKWKDPVAAAAEIAAERKAAADAMDTAVIDLTKGGAAAATPLKMEHKQRGRRKKGDMKDQEEKKQEGAAEEKKKKAPASGAKNQRTSTLFVPPAVSPSAEVAEEAAKWKAALKVWMDLLPKDAHGTPAAWNAQRAFNDLFKPVCDDPVMQSLITTLRTAGLWSLSGNEKTNLNSKVKAVSNYLAVHDPQAYALFFLEATPQDVVAKLIDPQQRWRADKKKLYRHLPQPGQLLFGDEVRSPTPSSAASAAPATVESTSPSEASRAEGKRAAIDVSDKKRKVIFSCTLRSQR